MTSAHGKWRYWGEGDRREWQNPEAILRDIGVKPGVVFMDIGCGDGFFTIPAARAAGEKGTVYALDSNPEAIERIRDKAVKEGLVNIELTTSPAENEVLCLECSDYVFYGIVLHDFADPVNVLANARKMLKPSGKLVDLDWKKEAMSFGPPVQRRFSEEEASHLIEGAGFKVEIVKECGPYHYLIVAVPGQ